MDDAQKTRSVLGRFLPILDCNLRLALGFSLSFGAFYWPLHFRLALNRAFWSWKLLLLRATAIWFAISSFFFWKSGSFVAALNCC